MALRAGDRLGAFEIVGLLGQGAMGEVYRARDTRLGRDVAIKVLPAGFATDPERLARLEREGRLISQINHPNICTIFDIVEGSNGPFLILELVEGETLRERLLRGPMPLREALRCTAGIAAALEAAHSKGIIHRDLKPSNIKMTMGGAKVLDFGVAKFASPSGSELGASDLTLTLGGTKEGVLVGTVAYVSPEQAMGDRVDERSDIWAFGCLVYEMLTAKRAFPGVAVADTLGAVMRGEPDWSALPGGTPQELRTLLRRCLEKDRGRRLAHIADARLEIDDLLSGRPEAAGKFAASSLGQPKSSPTWRARLTLTLTFLAGVVFATVIASVFFNRSGGAEPPDSRTTAPFSAPAGEQQPPATMPPAPQVETPPASSSAPPRANILVEGGRSASPSSAEPASGFVNLLDGMRWAPAVDSGVPNTIVAISPDGRLVVYSARAKGITALWLRSLTLGDTWELPGTDGAISPFWSPDAASIGFFADRKLKRVDLNGLGTRSSDPRVVKAAMTLCQVAHQRGGTWGPDDTIVFAPFPGELKRISANGGAVASLTRLERGEPHHVRPQFLAGTRQLLYRVSSNNGRNNSYYVTSMDGGERKLIATLDAGNVIYAQGHLLFMQDHTLMAQAFDVKTLATSGPPQRVAIGVLLSTGSPPVFGVFSASQTGRLVYLSQGHEYNDRMTVLSNWTGMLNVR